MRRATWVGIGVLMLATVSTWAVTPGQIVTSTYRLIADKAYSLACAADAVVFDNNGVLGCPKTSDVAPQPLTIRSQPAYAQGTQTAANLVIAGGMDEKKVTIDNATCNAGDTVSVYINNAGSLSTSVLTYGTEWCASGCGTAALKATSLASAIDALTGVSSIAVSDVAYVTPDVLTVADVYFAESDATCTTVSAGTNGTVRMPANQVMEWTGRLKKSSPADGKEYNSNNAGTADSCWDYQAVDNLARLYAGDCSSGGTLQAAVLGASSTISMFASGYSGDAAFYANNSGARVNYSLTVGWVYSAVTCPDNGTPAVAATCNSISGYSTGVMNNRSAARMTCNDADGCTQNSLSETSVVDGTLMYLVNIGSNTWTMQDTAGNMELAGDFAMGQYDSMTLQYIVDRWIELGRSDN